MRQSYSVSYRPEILALILVLALLSTLLPGAAPVMAQCVDHADSTAAINYSEFNLYPDGLSDMVMAGDIGWAAQTTYGALVSVDCSDPDSLVVLGSARVTVMDETYDVDVSGDLGFVSYLQWGGAAGVRVFDISDPAAPQDIGDFQGPGWASYLAARDSFLYVSFSYTTFGVLDVSDGTAPVLIGQVPVTQPWEISLAGNLAYVATEGQPVIIDISDPTNPLQVGTLPTTANSNKIEIAGNRAYVATDAGLEIFDVTDPASPQAVGDFATAGMATYVFVSGEIAYVPVHNVGTHVFDIRDPSQPGLLTVINIADHLPPHSVIQWGKVKEQGGRLHLFGNDALYITSAQCPLGTSGVELPLPDRDLRLAAWPNPFNPQTVIEFELPAAARTNLAIYDLGGRLVRTLVDGERLSQGRHQHLWGGRDRAGREMPSGVYFSRLRAGAQSQILKLTLVR